MPEIYVGPRTEHYLWDAEKNASASGRRAADLDPTRWPGARLHQWMANREGGQTYGNQSIVLPMGTEVYAAFVKKIVGVKDFATLQKKNPELAQALVFLYKLEGRGDWKLGRVRFTMDELGFPPEDPRWALEVDSFDSSQARKQGMTFDSGPAHRGRRKAEVLA